MDKHYFLRAGIHFDSSLSPSPMSTWQSPPDQPFLNHNWDKSTEHLHYSHFDSALSPMVSSPGPGPAPADSFAIRELIGKLGTICNAGEVSLAIPPAGCYSAGNSCYSTPLNSPPNLPAVAADPGFAERAAKFSCFGSRSFNGRTSQFGLNNNEAQFRSATPLMNNNGKLHRVSSNPSLRLAGSPIETNKLPISTANSNDDSSVSEQNPSGENGFRGQNDINSRKRKPISRKAKEDSVNATKKAEDEDSKAKRSKLTEKNVKAEDDQKQGNNNDSPKPPEPPKDYIHVRARRGQATDSHSLAERVRREKISERMKLLQDLVPGCNKVTGKALMLDEIINYVQSLQCQVEFLSMKLASVNPRLDINMDNILSKDLFQPNSSLPNHNQSINSSVSALFGHQNQQIHNNNISSNGAVDTLGLQLPQIDIFGEHLPQFSTFCEDDLQSIVQMGFGDNDNSDLPFQLQSFDDAGQNQTTQMKIEL